MHRLAPLLPLVIACGCASVDVVRLQPDLLHTPRGTEPLAGIQTTCLGFYLFTVGIPEADLDKAVNELLLKEAKKLGADRVINLRFEGTPGNGIWWLTKLFWFRSARASGVAVVAEPASDDGTGNSGDGAAEKPPIIAPPKFRLHPARVPKEPADRNLGPPVIRPPEAPRPEGG